MLENHKVNSDTALFGVFGDPVRHSKSPVMMNRAFQTRKYNGVYAAFHVSSENLSQAVGGIRALGFRGINVTIPHKVEIMKELDHIDEAAQIIGAVNTIVNDNGQLIGYNTDGIGYVRSLKEETQLDLSGKNILIVGAGGAARGVVYALSQERPNKIWIANRTIDKAKLLALQFSNHADVEGISIDQIGDVIDKAQVLINHTPIGMSPHIDATPVSKELLHPQLVVSDLIYNPLKTRLLEDAESLGCTIHGGLGMFIYQGAYAFEYWTGLEAPVKEMREVVIHSLQNNIA